MKQLQRVHINIQNKRSDFQWKLAHQLCKANKIICIEDLHLEAMKRLWGKKISDLSHSNFLEKLNWVAQKYDTQIVKIDRYYPSSKLCSCGEKNDQLKLSDRKWNCESCGTTHDRDLLAANNILSEGIRLCRTKNQTALAASLV